MKFIAAIFILTTNLCFSQGWVPGGARSMSLANTSVIHSDVWAYHNNPGALGAIDKFTIGVSYENRFLLKELQSQGLAVAVPLKYGVLSVGGHMYGYNQYRSYKGGLGYSLKLFEKFYAGVQLNYQGLKLSQNYGSKNSMSAEAGIYAKFSEKWNLGFSVFNIGRARVTNAESSNLLIEDRFSTIMRLGSSYSFSSKVNLAIEFEKDLEYKFRFKTGLEYEVINDFFIRGGFATTPIELTLGFGYHFKQIHIDLGSAYHQILGWSPHFSLVFVGK